MISVSELESRLGYDESSHYRRIEGGPLAVETAHLFHTAREIGVRGIYVFEASPPGKAHNLLPERPAVYVAEAASVEEARKIHRSLWNQGYAPFIIIRLPNQIRIYTGFSYAEKSERKSLLAEIDDERLSQLNDRLADFHATAIDKGQIWKSYAPKLDPKQRVDQDLLKNLRTLGNALKEDGLRDFVAHALIGKYVYLHYLRDRRILSDEWLKQHHIHPDSVFKRDVTINGLRELSLALENRFNGEIFPIDFDRKDTKLKDEHVSWVASVFMGDEVIDTDPDVVRQLHLPFKAYDFQYIPVETLSAIYEQFIFESKQKGAIYTPEFLADYLLSEVEWACELRNGMKVLDPACGSGVFLVLAYRRLIEKEMARLGRKLNPDELRDILESIYGIEREQDACYVAEFSLLLTLLHYLEPRDLQNLEFQFPRLHDKQIFACDFFAPDAKFWGQGLKFDCIIGNPPWIELKPSTKGEQFVRAWIESHKADCPVGGYRVAEAFSWLVTDLLTPDGIVGLILPATSLVNLKSQNYRKQFFTQHEVLRMTNFSNLREVLFDRRGTLPAATIVYRVADATQEKPRIIHYAPLSVNQVYGAKVKPWVITINENEIQTLSPYEAEKGETFFWKLALWGTHRDKRAIERIEYLFPNTLKEICKKRGWVSSEGLQLRNGHKGTHEKLAHVAELEGKKRFQTDLMRKSSLRFSISQGVLENIPHEMCYLRKRGGKAGLKVIQAPHIILSPFWMSYITYSDEDFVIPPRQIGIAGPEADAAYLRGLALYLSSSLVAYYLFFYAPEWGVFRQARLVTIAAVRQIPTPEFTPEQVKALAALQKELVEQEKREVEPFESGLFAGHGRSHDKQRKHFLSELRRKLQKRIDDAIFDLLGIPDDIRLLVEEFIGIRLLLDKPSAIQSVIRKPTEAELLAYARELQDELDDFAMGSAYHQVTVNHSSELIECVVEITRKDGKIPVNAESIKSGNVTMTQLHATLRNLLQSSQSQWVYVQRGLRLFDGPRVHIYKPPRLIDWTQTQALNDADDIIGEVIAPA